MMTLLEQIRAVYMAQRKARAVFEVAALSTLIGEIETLAKAGKGEMTDAVVVTVVKKFIKNLDEAIAAVISNSAADMESRLAAMNAERALYEQFLPKQLSEAELKFVIDEIVAAGNTNVGDAMKALKTDHGGRYDGAMASAILKAKFAK
jgi:uncharacterized protein YqeY